MGWRYPKYKLRSGGVVGYEDFNENLYAFTEEVNGSLDAQNFNADAITRTLLDDDAAYRLHSKSQYDDRVSGGSPKPFDLEACLSWQEIDDITVTFQTKGGVVWAMASFQADPVDTNLAAAIFVNGQLMVSSLIGDADRVQAHSRPKATPRVIITAPATSTAGVVHEAGLVSEVVTYLPPGDVEVSLRVMSQTPEATKGAIRSREMIVLEMLA